MKSILTEGFRKTSPETVVNFIKQNKIDVIVPSDVTDTMFLAEHYHKIAPHVKLAITENVKIYEIMEDKWENYKMLKQNNIATPSTELFDKEKEQQYPFFLKVASGTNGGRGVWYCRNDDDLRDALKSKEANSKAALLLRQTPIYGDIICAQVIYKHGKPVGFFFAKSIKADDLSGIGKNYVFSRSKSVRDMNSHVKVELSEDQWNDVSMIFEQIGKATDYHGMIDIEFIVAGPSNSIAERGSIWLLECNPRFSGGIHTTLSNPGFLDLYFDVVNGNLDTQECTVCGNYSRGVDMRATFGQFKPTNFYMEHPFKVLCVRHWQVNNSHTYIPLTVSRDRSSDKKLNNKSMAHVDSTVSTTETISVSSR
ncbi:ATP-grasp domain containing protein [Nitzschia inconspicua]|uniref:ATP-grasp domain containing protein n=1 Tax=Nitzschia inconspicua TaxID=303405 RepID=A0A9K3KTX6_9STRA|nr:ATP-grasp domain containing protein [Nitzschia inconspicua]